jgi:hypothetical protein
MCFCLLKKRTGLAPIKRIYQGIVTGAKKRKLTVELSLAEVQEMVLEPCFFCCREPYVEKFAYHKKAYYYGKNLDESIVANGIDRLDSTKGYTKENCVSCCVYCNRAKSDLSVEEFKQQIERLYFQFVRKQEENNENIGINSESVGSF